MLCWKTDDASFHLCVRSPSLMPPLDPTVEMPTTIGFVGPQPQVKEANWIKLQATALGDAMDAVIWLTTLEWQLAYSMLYKVQLRCGDLHSFKGFFRYLHLENEFPALMT